MVLSFPPKRSAQNIPPGEGKQKKEKKLSQNEGSNDFKTSPPVGGVTDR
jgi:hypothetical protein